MTLPILTALAVTVIALALLKQSAICRWMGDVPNERSLHTNVVPRIGGAGMLIGLAGASLWLPTMHNLLGIATIGYLVLFAVSFADDVRSMPIAARLATHSVVAAAWSICVGGPWWVLFVGFLLVVWSINLYNFMDGSDGLAGGMAVIGFSTYAWGAYTSGDFALAALCGSIAAAAAGFLLFNFHPASLFLGDSGSIPLGFLAAAIGWYGVHRGLWTLTLPILAFFPFYFDATYTLARRLVRRERFWLPHREHLYQRAIRSGLGHRAVALASYSLMVVTAGVGLATLQSPTAVRVAIVAAMTLAALWLAAVVNRRFSA